MAILKISFFVIDYSHGGGVEKATLKLMDLFNKNSMPVHSLFSLYKSNAETLYTYPESLKITVLSPPNKNAIEKSFKKYFDQEKPDVVIAQGDNLTISIALLKVAKACGVRVLPQFHGSPMAYLKKYIFDTDLKNNPALIFKKLFAGVVYPFKKAKMLSYLQLAENGLFTVSQGAKQELEHLYGKAATKKVATIYNPITLQLDEEISQKENWVSYVGRLESRHKNAMLVLRAWKLLPKIHTADWKLLLVGDGSLRKEMEKFVIENDLQNVVFTGFTNDVGKYLKQSTISVSTSNCEGFGLSVLEAMCHANAIAATKSDGGMGDLIVAEKTGLVSEKNDAAALAKNIKRLMDDEALRQKFTKNAFAHIKEIYAKDILQQWKKATGGDVGI